MKTKEGNNTTIDQQIRAVQGEVKMYVSRMTWHPHQMALDDATRTLATVDGMTKVLEQIKTIVYSDKRDQTEKLNDIQKFFPLR